MKVKWRHNQHALLLSLGFAFCTPAAAAPCQHITIAGPPDFPPIVWSDFHETHGAAKDLLQKVLAEHGIQTSTDHVGGYRRVLKAAQDGRIQLIAGIPRNPTTESIVQFTNTPLYSHNLTVLIRRNEATHPASWEELSEKKGAMPNQLTITDVFSTDREPIKMIRTFSPKLALKMLAVGRVDYTIYPNIQDDLFVSLLNMEGRFEKLPLFSKKIPVYAGFSRQLNCELPLEGINRSIQRMVDSGESEQILNDSLYKWMNYQLKKRDTL